MCCCCCFLDGAVTFLVVVVGVVVEQQCATEKSTKLGYRKGSGVAGNPACVEWVHWWVVCSAGYAVICIGGACMALLLNCGVGDN